MTTEQYGVNCARIEALVPHVHVVMTAVGPVVLLHTACDGLCGKWHQEKTPMDDVALFRGAHVRKGSGICCCIHDTLMNMHLLYICMYIWELPISLDFKVCGCNSACIYSIW